MAKVNRLRARLELGAPVTSQQLRLEAATLFMEVLSALRGFRFDTARRDPIFLAEHRGNAQLVLAALEETLQRRLEDVDALAIASGVSHALARVASLLETIADADDAKIVSKRAGSESPPSELAARREASPLLAQARALERELLEDLDRLHAMQRARLDASARRADGEAPTREVRKRLADDEAAAREEKRAAREGKEAVSSDDEASEERLREPASRRFGSGGGDGDFDGYEEPQLPITHYRRPVMASRHARRGAPYRWLTCELGMSLHRVLAHLRRARHADTVRGMRTQALEEEARGREEARQILKAQRLERLRERDPNAEEPLSPFRF